MKRFTYAAAGWTASLLIVLGTTSAAIAQSTVVKPAARGESFSFALWGDMPYAKASDEVKIPALLNSLNGAKIAFSAYDGDIKDGSSECTDQTFSEAVTRFNTLKAPAIYVPGDNEWTDCHRTNNGGYNNLERLDYLRKTMFASGDSFGQQKLALEHQAAPYIENTRWTYGDVMFVGLNIPGSNNNKVSSEDECTSKSARTLEDCDADNAEYEARDAANIEWLRSSFQLAKDRKALGLMIVMQADVSFDLPETETFDERTRPGYDGYDNFVASVVQETQAFPGQVVLVHGDTHFFKMDKPLIDQAHLIQNFTRLETFGSPNVHWVRVDVDPKSQNVFAFVPVLVPGN